MLFGLLIARGKIFEKWDYWYIADKMAVENWHTLNFKPGITSSLNIV